MTRLHSLSVQDDTGQRELLRVLRAFTQGDFSARMAPDAGVDGEVAEAFNDVARAHEAMAAEIARLLKRTAADDRSDGGAKLSIAAGGRRLADGMVRPVLEAAGSTAARTQGDVPAMFTGPATSVDTSEAGFAGLWHRAGDVLDRLVRPKTLQTKAERLRRTNRRLEENARLLAEQMRQVEYKNREVELARLALQQKAEQLALSSRYKTEFLANMSHELRTPLNSLLILAQMLAENPESNLTSKQVEYAQTIHAAGQDLLTLINDVLDLAKVESGTVTLEMATEHFAELRDFLDRAFQQVGHDKGLKFAISIERGLPSALRTDTRRLRQILKNLLSNAFKFTPKGSVSLRVALATSGWTPGHAMLDAAGTVVSFAVVDSGIGIAPHMQEIIFEAFQQGDGTSSRQFGGTGLGLSISAGLARLLGGEIKVRSSPGQGSTFLLFLPLLEQPAGERTEAAGAGSGFLAASRIREEQARVVADVTPALVQDAAGIESADAASMPGLTAAKVLLVDDDIRNIFALTSVLEEQGMVVMNAENGLDGIETLRNNPDIDIVLMDMMMPELDGYDTIRIMRRLEGVGRIPIIGISARAMKGDREKCIEAGASDYISKPVEIEHLLAVMQAWLLSP